MHSEAIRDGLVEQDGRRGELAELRIGQRTHPAPARDDGITNTCVPRGVGWEGSDSAILLPAIHAKQRLATSRRDANRPS